MCRYSDGAYRSHFVCFGCREMVQSSRSQKPKCPRCSEVMKDMGRDFKTPRKNSDSGWRKAAILGAAGVRFDSCGCEGPGIHVPTLAIAKEVAKRSYHSAVRQEIYTVKKRQQSA